MFISLIHSNTNIIYILQVTSYSTEYQVCSCMRAKHAINKFFEVAYVGFVPWISADYGSIVALQPTFSGESTARDEQMERRGSLFIVVDEQYQTCQQHVKFHTNLRGMIESRPKTTTSDEKLLQPNQ